MVIKNYHELDGDNAAVFPGFSAAGANNDLFVAVVGERVRISAMHTHANQTSDIVAVAYIHIYFR